MVVKDRTANMDLIDELELSERAYHLKELFFECPVSVKVDRSVLATQSWQETEGEPLDIRRAKLLKKICEGLAIGIEKGQKLVGGMTDTFRGSQVIIEFSTMWTEWLLKDLASLEEGETEVRFSGSAEKGTVTPETKAALEEMVNYWKGRTPGDKIRAKTKELMGSWYDDTLKSGGTFLQDGAPFDDIIPRFNRLVKEGLRGHIKEAEERIQAWRDNREHDVDKLYFWQASVISCEAAIILANRYAELAKSMAAKEEDPEWRAELLEIARTCERVPENPARTFREALQTVHLIFTALSLENWSPPTGLGRMDRYLYPFFQQDLAEGRLTLQEAAELLGDLFVFCIKQEIMQTGPMMAFMQKGQLISIGLAGTDEKGEDVCNELSYLFLHVLGLLKTPEPHLMIGWHKGIPNWMMRKALDANWKAGGGMPHFQNVDAIVDLMVRRGVSLENARNWEAHGCSQVTSADQSAGMMDGYPNVVFPVDLVLHNGMGSRRGVQIGPETGDPRNFKTFEEFYKAYQIQLENLLRKVMWHDNIADRLRGEYHRQPLASTLLPGPLEKGKDFAIGGLRNYKMVFKKDRGYVPAGDSLTAVKKLVYDEKKITMAELIDAIDSDFAGERGEEIRQMCANAPKYGNDIDEADFMVRDIAKFGGDILTSIKNVWGDYVAINRNGEAWHTLAGQLIPALPNGRKSGTTLPDASLSPMQGVDRCGPTAVLNSALKANFKEHVPAGIMTLRFSAPLLATPEIRDKVISLMESFMEEGGTYLQYNILDAKKLQEAKVKPEKYRDLLVRVGGYSAFFITLHEDVQDELIRRTEQSLSSV